MQNIKNFIEVEIQHTKLMINEINSRLVNHYEGTLVLQCKNGKLKYYKQFREKETSQKKQVLIGDEFCDEVKMRKLERYFMELKCRLQKNLNILEPILNKLQNYAPEDIYNDLPFAYKDVEIIENTSLDCDKKNTNFKFTNKPVEKRMTDRVNITIDGTIVRSKGEVIIYNMLWLNGVKFKYEQNIEVVEFNGSKRPKSPDFVIELRDGSFLFWEHLGMVGSQGYSTNFADKLQVYHKNGIVAGDNFIITSDRYDGSINSKAINDIIVNMVLPICKIKKQTTA